ncbi:unnamed protein product [Lathyrus oleraceus]
MLQSGNVKLVTSGHIEEAEDLMKIPSCFQLSIANFVYTCYNSANKIKTSRLQEFTDCKYVWEGSLG